MGYQSRNIAFLTNLRRGTLVYSVTKKWVVVAWGVSEQAILVTESPGCKHTVHCRVTKTQVSSAACPQSIGAGKNNHVVELNIRRCLQDHTVMTAAADNQVMKTHILRTINKKRYGTEWRDNHGYIAGIGHTLIVDNLWR